MRILEVAHHLARATLVAAVSAVAATAALADTLPTDRAGLDAYIRDYILKNPQVLREALIKLEADEQTANTKRVLSGLKGELYGAGSPEIGNADAKISIVEFFDYNCPYCRATHAQLKDFLSVNADTKVVLKDIASLGKDSEAVARVVIAARKQGRFADLHEALMTQKGKLNEARALEVAAKLGFDVERIKKEARSPDVGDELERTQKLANSVNVMATPLYIVGHNGIQGAPEDFLAQITKHLEEIRKSGCDVC